MLTDDHHVDDISAHSLFSPIQINYKKRKSTTATEITTDTNTITTESSVHLLPCRIEYTGPAAVKTYFHPQKIEDPSRLPSNAEEQTDSKLVLIVIRYILLS